MSGLKSEDLNNAAGNLKYDIPAGLVVFLVALPLCLGISQASTPIQEAGSLLMVRKFMISGVIAGMIGGLIIPLISNSHTSVAGPAAGLTVIVLTAVQALGFEQFLVSVIIAGVLQILLGVVRAGTIAYFFPSAVIKGMLAAIGITLILKQLSDFFGFSEADDGRWHIETGAAIPGIVSLLILIFWQKTPLKNVMWLPAALVVVVLGGVVNWLYPEDLTLEGSYLVNLAETKGVNDFLNLFTLPAFEAVTNPKTWTTGLTIGLVASLETLLTIDAVDSIDPYKRRTNLNRELIAQGVANLASGLIGGLPITSVIVRSSANINAGARTKASAFVHGLLLFMSVVFLAGLLNHIPKASLAAILLLVGYKLARPELFKVIYRKGLDQFIPFAVTIVAILLTDLLVGILIGIAVGLVFVIITNYHSALTVVKDGKAVLIKFNKDVSFLNKAVLQKTLLEIEDGSDVIIDGTRAVCMDSDIREMINDFIQSAELREIEVELININKSNITHLNVLFNKHGGIRKTTASK